MDQTTSVDSFPDSPLARVLALCDNSQAELARRVSARGKKCDSRYVWNWVKRDGKVPADYVLDVEAAVEGRVTRYQLRPDVFGPAPQEQVAA